MDMEKRRNRIRHISAHRTKRELRLTPGFQTHEALWVVTTKVPTKFQPYRERKRSDGAIAGDCSCNCRWFHVLAGRRGHGLGHLCKSEEPPRGPTDP